MAHVCHRVYKKNGKCDMMPCYLMLGAQANIWPLLEAQLQLLSTNTALLPKHTNSLKQLTEAHDKLSCQSQKPRDHNAGSGSASCDGDMVMAVITILFMKSMVEVTLVTVVLNNVLLAQQMLRLPKGSYHCCRLLHLRFFCFVGLQRNCPPFVT